MWGLKRKCCYKDLKLRVALEFFWNPKVANKPHLGYSKTGLATDKVVVDSPEKEVSCGLANLIAIGLDPEDKRRSTGSSSAVCRIQG